MQTVSPVAGLGVAAIQKGSHIATRAVAYAGTQSMHSTPPSGRVVMQAALLPSSQHLIS